MGRKARYRSKRFRFDIDMRLVISGAHLLDPSGPTLSQQVLARLVPQIQDAAIGHLKDEYRRPNVASGRLIKALRDRQMWSASDTELYMFQRDFLDREVPYWDVIDRGTKWFVNKGWVLSGYWLDEGVPAGFDPSQRGSGQGRLIIPKPGARIRGQSGRFAGQYANKGTVSGAARSYLRSQGHKGRENLRVRGVIKTPIHAHEYIAAARQHFLSSDVNTIAHQVLRDVALARGLRLD